MHEASVFTPPPGAVATPCQVAVGPPGLGPTEPEAGFCARVVRNGIEQKRPILHIRKSVPMVIRAAIEEEFFFMDGLRGLSSEISYRGGIVNTFLRRSRNN